MNHLPELLAALQAVVRRSAEEVRAKLVHRGEADAGQVHLGLAEECDRVAAREMLLLSFATEAITRWAMFIDEY